MILNKSSYRTFQIDTFFLKVTFRYVEFDFKLGSTSTFTIFMIFHLMIVQLSLPRAARF